NPVHLDLPHAAANDVATTLAHPPKLKTASVCGKSGAVDRAQRCDRGGLDEVVFGYDEAGAGDTIVVAEYDEHRARAVDRRLAGFTELEFGAARAQDGAHYCFGGVAGS